MSTARIIGGPLTLYYGAVGAAARANTVSIDTPPASATWTLLGGGVSTDKRYYDEEGVTLGFDQTIEEEMVLHDTLPEKAFRVSEANTVAVTLKDWSLQAVAQAMGFITLNTAVPASGTLAATQSVDLVRGFPVNEVSLLARANYSPHDDGTQLPAVCELYFPRVYVSENGEAVFSKTSSMLPITFKVLAHATKPYFNVKTANKT